MINLVILLVAAVLQEISGGGFWVLTTVVAISLVTEARRSLVWAFAVGILVSLIGVYPLGLWSLWYLVVAGGVGAGKRLLKSGVWVSGVAVGIMIIEGLIMGKAYGVWRIVYSLGWFWVSFLLLTRLVRNEDELGIFVQ